MRNQRKVTVNIHKTESQDLHTISIVVAAKYQQLLNDLTEKARTQGLNKEQIKSIESKIAELEDKNVSKRKYL